MHYQSIPAGTDVEYQGVVYRVRAAYGRVLELEGSDCSFARVVHVSSVKRLPPAHENLGCGLAAPAGVGQGVDTRNRAAWLSIADFLTLENLRAVLAARAAQGAEGAPLAGEVSAPEVERASAAINFGGCVAPCTASVPDGNHGDNFSPSSSQVLA